MASIVTRCQSNKIPYGCGGTGYSRHGHAADKLCDMNLDLWEMFSAFFWMKNEGSYEGKTEFQPSTNTVVVSVFCNM